MTILSFNALTGRGKPGQARQFGTTAQNGGAVDLGGEVEFLEPSDATAGVELDLPRAIAPGINSGFHTDDLQSFEAMIVAALADVIGTLAPVANGSDGE